MQELVGFDIDGTIVNTYAVMSKLIGNIYGIEFTEENPMPYDPDKNGFDLSHDEFMNIWSTAVVEKKFKPFEGTVEVLREYYKKTKRLVFITHRNSPKTVKATKTFLAEEIGVPYELYTCYKCEKVYVAEGLGITGFIDDMPEICASFIDAKKDAYLYVAPWHKYIPNLNGMPRVNNWEEIAKIIL